MKTPETLKIFIADDDLVCRRIYEQHMRKLGYSLITTFSNPKDCLAHLTENPDIVFLDSKIRVAEEEDLVKKIKLACPHTYVVIISLHGDMRTVIDAFKEGAFDYIIKGEQDLQLMALVLKAILAEMNRPTGIKKPASC